MSNNYQEELYTQQELREMDLQMLRDDLVGELNAINQYQEHIDSLESEEAVAMLEHIIADEKEHVAELTKLINKLDATQAEKFAKEGL
ncbi:MAG TPA: hypothetical protein G4O03_06175 [Dehalococcoidia bacterium]|nr:hypothetical protein [Dehalococcoidia bacterium]